MSGTLVVRGEAGGGARALPPVVAAVLSLPDGVPPRRAPVVDDFVLTLDPAPDNATAAAVASVVALPSGPVFARALVPSGYAGVARLGLSPSGVAGLLQAGASVPSPLTLRVGRGCGTGALTTATTTAAAAAAA